MKIHRLVSIAALAAAAIAAGSAHAADNSFYASAAVGSTKFSVDCTGLSSCDTTGSGFKLVGGWMFYKDFGAELGYYDFGKTSFTGTFAGSTINGGLKSSGFGLGIAYLPKLSNDWGASFRLGLLSMRTKLSGTVSGMGSASDAETHAVPYVSLGIDYALTKSIRVEGTIDSSRAEYGGDSGTVRAFSLGLRADF